MNFLESETLKNLTRAYAGECEDGAKYQFLADMANQQKLSEVGTTLKALATNEMAHAKIFYDYIGEQVPGGVPMVEISATYPMQHGSLINMLKIKAENELRQHEIVYPEFAKIANEEGFEDIAQKIEEIALIEMHHSDTLLALYEKLANNKLYSASSPRDYKCVNCGHTEHNKKGWKKCPLCGKDQGMIKLTLCECTEDCTCN